MCIETIKRPDLIFGLLVATGRGSGNAVDPESAALLPVASHIRTTRQGVTEYVIETPHERSRRVVFGTVGQRKRAGLPPCLTSLLEPVPTTTMWLP